ncbi:MAG TPA: S16 family serine protease, partial [Candidatus Methylacidiphilales bacterium]|nr:S16 family serine protease [Candidatus Methylacidiphilales bacterium]
MFYQVGNGQQVPDRLTAAVVRAPLPAGTAVAQGKGRAEKRPAVTVTPVTPPSPVPAVPTTPEAVAKQPASAQGFTPAPAPSSRTPAAAPAPAPVPAPAPAAPLPSAAASPESIAGNKYVAPDLSYSPFIPARITIPAEERANLASLLAEQVRNLKAPTSGDATTSARLIAIALRLDSGNRAAILMNGRLRRALPITPTPGLPDNKAFAQKLMEAHKKLQPSNPDDMKLAGCLLDLASTADPSNDDILLAAETLKADDRPDWARLTMAAPGSPTAPSSTPNSGITLPGATGVTPPVPTPPATTVPVSIPEGATETIKVKGLVVSDGADGEMMGKVMELIVTRSSAPDLTITINGNGKVAEDMTISADEAKRLAMQRAGVNQAKANVTVSFDNKYAQKAGGSAGTAFAVAITAVLERITLDPNFALTGDITVDGKVRKIGGVAAKIEGAVADGCKVVAVPEDNSEDVADMVLLTSPQALTTIQ